MKKNEHNGQRDSKRFSILTSSLIAKGELIFTVVFLCQDASNDALCELERAVLNLTTDQGGDDLMGHVIVIYPSTRLSDGNELQLV